MIRRKRYDKLTLQGNFYPMSSAAYIEDDRTRLTLFGAQPLGVASLESGNYYILYVQSIHYLLRLFGSNVRSSIGKR
jgi:hypothetical protein